MSFKNSVAGSINPRTDTDEHGQQSASSVSVRVCPWLKFFCLLLTGLPFAVRPVLAVDESAEQTAMADDAANKAIDAELQQSGETMFGDFQSVWDGIQQEQLANGMTEINPDWIAEFDSQKPWSPDLSSTKSIPNMGEYMFEPDNPYMTLEDPFLEGKRLMESGGNLSLAALAFEAAVQRKEDHVEAWTMLGSCQAQNEKETPAIRALETALKLDNKNLDAMMVPSPCFYSI